jgi:signal transduction histidine kinase
VFDRHFRGDKARNHRAAGSGLGLPIAKALAQAHGGSLTLESPANEAAGVGTRVVLRLPLLTTSAVPAHAQTL